MSNITDGFRKVQFFLADVRNELRKSTWPTRGELIESTVVVILSVILFAVFVGLCDAVLRQLVGLVVRH
ncbi:MAG: preprotein translocase subunit SecE [bacterium]|jgi:preprotein translocase subunit SecE